MTQDTDPMIVRVYVPREAMATERRLRSEAPFYSVVVSLSRPIQPFEKLALAISRSPILIKDEDPMQAVIANTTLDQVRTNLPDFTAQLSSAVTQGARLKEEAAEEDERMLVLAEQINAQLTEALRARQMGQ